MRHINTFSMVAYDPEEQAWGVAVASKFLAVGSVVPWAQAGAGAIATQAYAKVSFGPDGLLMLASGVPAQEILDRLLELDPGQAERQIGVVDVQGRAAAHTGVNCMDWAGHRIGVGFACQGNILAGPEVLDAMAETFMTATGELSDRLFAALRAADLAGGDRRGKQSAALYIANEDSGYGGDNDRYIDLRVDDDPEPVTKLGTLLTMHHLFFGEARPEDQLDISEDIARELQTMMQATRHYSGEINGLWDDATKAAFRALIGSENLEERWRYEQSPDHIDRVALEYLRSRFGR
ncbi:MAG: DUF1028 domain-containing protein [Chloroflexi bacterium]|nr:DUF1028 domain-containing protein [Chloroflexota bacterium]